MLTKWTLGNFKSVADKTTLSLAPITVLVGENSSGKSTILQSILLVAQTVRATQSRQPLLLNGEFIRLGYLEDILYNGNKSLPLELGFELQPIPFFDHKVDREATKRDPIELEMKIKSSDTGARDSLDEYLSYLSLRNGEEDTIILEHPSSKGKTLLDPEENKSLQMLAELRNEINTNHYDTSVTRIRFSRGTWLNKIAPYDFHASLYHFLPNKILETFNAVQYALFETLRSAGSYLRVKEGRRSIMPELASVLSLDVTNFRDRLGGLLRKEINDAIYSNLSTGKAYNPQALGSTTHYLRMAIDYLGKSQNLEDWLSQIKRDIPERHARIIGDRLIHRASLVERNRSFADSFYGDLGVRAANLPESLENVRSRIVNFFSEKIYYLGPLREDPMFIYSLPPYPELTHVGLKGEFTASVLERFKNKEIEYSAPSNKDGVYLTVKKAKLIDALSQWLEYMGLIAQVSTKDRGKIGTELMVRSKGVNQDLDLTSIGVGVSQVLPTLVMGLIAPAGTIFLLEQPELHLHPKVQSMVADFLLGLTMVGKQCIVETHSEYLVNRLRRRVAEDESDKLAEEVTIYFVERQNGRSNFRKLDLNQYGSLLSWPEGFFDEGPNEAELIMKAALKKRQQKKEARPQAK